MMSLPWLWIYSGLALLLLELVVPGFILCFFGLAAMTVGGIAFLFGDAFGLRGQMAAFSALSVLYIVLLRRWLKSVFAGSKVTTATDFENEYVGRVGKVTEAIEPPLAGRVLVGDAEWTAVAASPVAVGATVKVVSQSNLTLKVECL